MLDNTVFHSCLYHTTNASSAGKTKSNDVILILANIPNKIPVSQNLLPEKVFSIHTMNSNRNDVMGISVAAKCVWAKNRGIVRSRRMNIAPLQNEPSLHQSKKTSRETVRINTFSTRFCI
jgi:hypothetical protein